jgi:hypothetical protein
MNRATPQIRQNNAKLIIKFSGSQPSYVHGNLTVVNVKLENRRIVVFKSGCLKNSGSAERNISFEKHYSRLSKSAVFNNVLIYGTFSIFHVSFLKAHVIIQSRLRNKG